MDALHGVEFSFLFFIIIRSADTNVNVLPLHTTTASELHDVNALQQ